MFEGGHWYGAKRKTTKRIIIISKYMISCCTGAVPEGEECQLADAWISEMIKDMALLSVTTLLP